MVDADDIRQLASLLRKTADTARLIATHAPDVDLQRILEIAHKIESLADDLDDTSRSDVYSLLSLKDRPRS